MFQSCLKVSETSHFAWEKYELIILDFSQMVAYPSFQKIFCIAKKFEMSHFTHDTKLCVLR